MTKTYRLFLSETLYGSYEIEARSEAEARKKALKLIRRNQVPYGIMNTTSGYEIVDICDCASKRAN